MSTVYPKTQPAARMIVDYVRVYEKTEDITRCKQTCSCSRYCANYDSYERQLMETP